MGILRMIVIISVIALSQALAADSSETTAPTPVTAGLLTLHDIGMHQPSDVESIIISYTSNCAYQLTQEDTPELLERLFRAVVELESFTAAPAGDWNIILFNKKGGPSGLLVFYCIDESEEGRPVECYIGGSRHSNRLDAVLYDVRRSAKAADLGAGVGTYRVRDVLLRLPNANQIKISTSSRQAKALIAKAQAIIDCVDLRAIVSSDQFVPYESLCQAERKFGSICLVPDQLIKMKLYVFRRENCEGMQKSQRSGLHLVGVECTEILCGSLMVMDYGNLQPPVVIIREKGRLSGYLYNALTRREQERVGVVEYGLTGHPSGDAEYYKNPKVLFSELGELTKQVYNMHNTQ